jgi:hypothetical protein
MPESTKVVDSLAMVAWVQDEPAASTVEQASVITGDPEIRKCAVVPVDWIGASADSSSS